MKVLFVGGRFGGKTTTVDCDVLCVRVPVLSDGGFGTIDYYRTDSKVRGQVVFRCDCG